jgi:pyridoxamine 5'-phosphate oxidase
VRYEYQRGQLDATDILDNPIDQLGLWIKDAGNSGALEPTAMCLSTVGPGGRPSSRFVLLRGLDDRGLCFYTHYSSRKGEEIAKNPFGCVAFWWPTLERQVRVEGTISKVDEGESDQYFASRPRESQIASAASPQSKVVSGREELENLYRHLAEEVGPGDVPRPTFWGGYLLVPTVFEFWQGRPARLHDRVRCRLVEGVWIRERLGP